MKRLTLLAIILAICCNTFAQTNLVPFTPPTEHPRLLIRRNEIPALRERLKRPEAQAILQRMKNLTKPMTDDERKRYDWNTTSPYLKMRGVTTEAQLDALDYLVNGNAEAGRKAATCMLDTLKRTYFGRQNDLSRPCGVMVFLGGLVYDWCYDLLSDTQKKEYIEEIKRCSNLLECGYPIKNVNPVNGHSCEYMILKDMLGASIAIYDEYPDMFLSIRKLLVDEFIPIRNYFYKGGMHHQGANYVSGRFVSDLFCQLILEKAGAGRIFDDSMQYLLYEHIYRRRDDGLVLKSGDCYNTPLPGELQTDPNSMMLASSMYKDPYLAYEFQLNPKVSDQYLIFDLLFRDFDLQGKTPDDLPLVKYFDTPYGSMIARTGWGQDAAIAEMRMIEQYTGNHQHHEAGSFYLFYKGPLAIDSGFYQGLGGHYGDAHNYCYHKRTIAHNALLVYDPDEVFDENGQQEKAGKELYRNDGGQRFPKYGRSPKNYKMLLSDEYTYGKTLSHWSNDDFAFVKCDITKAYNPAKVNDVKRSMVFVNLHDSKQPAAMVVYDHVVSTNKDFRKYFLLHTSDEPQIQGNVSTILAPGTRGGMLTCTTLLPEKAEVASVGGPGKEFWVFGKNYPMVNKKTEVIGDEEGRWRIEVCPSKSSEEDCFLNVLQISNSDVHPEHVRHVSSAGVEGVAFNGKAVLFCQHGGFHTDNFSFKLPTGNAYKILVTDLKAGKWQVTFPNGKKAEKEVGESENQIMMEGPAGKYTMRRL